MALLSSPLKRRVSSFLTSEGTALQPELRENCNQIFALMQRHRNDEAFWAPFTDLLRSLVEDVVNAEGSKVESAPQVQLLASWDVNFLAQRLREALPHEDDSRSKPGEPVDRPAWSQFARGLSPNLLGAFLLLGLAASACSGSNSGTQYSNVGGSGATGGASAGGTSSTGGAVYACERDAGNTLGAGGTSAADAGYPLPANCCYDTASALWETIDASTLSQSDKQSLYTCFRNLNATWCDGLVELFKTSAPNVVAAALEKLLTCCELKPSAISGDYSAAQQLLLQGSLCMVPVYKGVTFPA